MSSVGDQVTYAAAIREALAEELRRDERVVLFGEDVAGAGGVFKVTEGLLAEFGPERVRDTPISEVAITGMAMGAALNGLRPILELMFADFIAVAYDELVNQIAKFAYQTGGQAPLPIVIRTASGGGHSFGAQHSQSPEAWLMHAPGLKVVAPSTPGDAKGLLKAAIRDDNPVCFFEHKALYWTKGETGEEELVPIGRAVIRRAGRDVTVAATGLMVSRALSASERLQEEGISTEVVDLRSLAPLDRETVAASLQRTGRLVTVEEAPGGIGWSAEILAWVLEEGLVDSGCARRVAPPCTPIPYSSRLEEAWLPSADRVVEGVRSLLLAVNGRRVASPDLGSE